MYTESYYKKISDKLFFFGQQVSNKATEFSYHYIDWSRVGELLRSGKHRYSWEELAIRGAIVGSTAAGAAVGYRSAKLNSGGWNLSGRTLMGAFVGFFVSHTVVIAPLIYKRYQASQACRNDELKILEALQNLNQLKGNNEVKHVQAILEKVPMIIHDVMYLSLSTEKRGNASQTWGYRKKVMNKIAMNIVHSVNTLLQEMNSVNQLNQLNQLNKYLDSFSMAQQTPQLTHTLS